MIDRLRRDEQPRGDLGIGEAAADQLDYLPLVPGQVGRVRPREDGAMAAGLSPGGGREARIIARRSNWAESTREREHHQDRPPLPDRGDDDRPRFPGFQPVPAVCPAPDRAADRLRCEWATGGLTGRFFDYVPKGTRPARAASAPDRQGLRWPRHTQAAVAEVPAVQVGTHSSPRSPAWLASSAEASGDRPNRVGDCPAAPFFDR
jgi:hypothetical protein